jgi:hypothetical protein
VLVWLAAFVPARAARATDAPDAPSRERPALPMLVVSPTIGWQYRHFRHTETSVPNERRYDANGFPAVGLSAEVFPAAKERIPFWQDLGLTLDFSRALGIKSQSARLGETGARPATVPVDTSFVRYGVGLRYRLPLAARTADPIAIGASVGYGAYRFGFDEGFGANALRPAPDLEVPNARYDLVVIGADLRAPLGLVAFSANAIYLHAFSVGTLGNRTPSGTADGVDLAIGVSVRLLKPLWLKVSADYAVLAFDLRPLAGREGDLPGRVVDSYVTVSTGPVVSF